MINNRVILPSFMWGSHIEPYSGYVTFFQCALCLFVLPFWFWRVSMIFRCVRFLLLAFTSNGSLGSLIIFPWISALGDLSGRGLTHALHGVWVYQTCCLSSAKFVVVVNTFSDQLMDLTDVDLIMASLVRDPPPSCTSLQSSDRQISMPFVLYSHWWNWVILVKWCPFYIEKNPALYYVWFSILVRDIQAS